MKEEKILKILIGIGLIAIVISIYIQYINPVFIEIKERERDATRMRDFSSLNSVLEKIRGGSGVTAAQPNTIYVSIPSDHADCNDLKLSPLPGNWKYSCKPKATFQKIDGTGWIPVDFTKFPEYTGANFSLPIDPLNSNNGHYYSYITDNGFVLTSLLESNKYMDLFGSKNNIGGSSLLEVGTDLNVIKKLALAKNLKLDLDFNKNDAIIDHSGGIQIDGIKTFYNFKDPNNYVMVKDNPSIQNIFKNGGSLSTWIYPKSSGKTTVGRIAEKSAETHWEDGWILYVKDILQTDKEITIGFIQRFSGNAAWESNTTIPVNTWSHIVLVYDSSLNTNDPTLYINGKKTDVKKTADATSDVSDDTGIDLYIGNDSDASNAFDSYIGEMRLYNRALSGQEASALYDLRK